ncbi:MAG: DUF4403 family protein [Bacteroidota bacterium]
MTNSKISEIHILIALEKAALQQVIDTQLPVDLLSQFSPPGADVRISVRRKGKIDLQVDKNTLTYQVPLQIFARKDTFLGNVDVLFEMYLGVATRFLFKENWELKTRSELIGYQWIKKPELDFGLFNYPLDKTILNAFESNKKTICEQLDKQIMSTVDVRPFLNNILSSIPNPILTPAGSQIAWQGDTFQTSMTPLHEKEGIIYAKLGLKGATQFAYGRTLPHVTTTVKAPDLISDLKEETHLQTHLLIDFRAVEKTAITLLQKQKLEFKHQKIEVRSVQISKAGKYLKISADLRGSFDGAIVLMGKPIFDPLKNEIRLESADLDIRGNNFISKTLVVFLRRLIQEKVMQNLQFPIQPSIDFANQKIKHWDFDLGGFAKGIIKSVNIPTIEVTEDALALELSVKGYVQLGLRSGENKSV